MSPEPEASEPATAMYRRRPETVAVDRGVGPPVVFSHGTLMDWTMFEPQLSALSEDYRTIAYNHRARTEHGHAPYDLDDLVDDCEAVLDAAGVDACVLAGMSMGGFMALRFALAHPERVNGLVLIDTMAEPHPEDERAEYEGMIEATRSAGQVDPELAEIVASLLFGETSLEERRDLVDTWIDRWLTYPGEAVYHEVNSWLHRPGVADRLDEIDVPTLVLHGAEDAAIDPDNGIALAEHLPDARHEVVPEAGHSSNLENPAVANVAIRDFLEEVY